MWNKTATKLKLIYVHALLKITPFMIVTYIVHFDSLLSIIFFKQHLSLIKVETYTLKFFFLLKECYIIIILVLVKVSKNLYIKKYLWAYHQISRII